MIVVLKFTLHVHAVEFAKLFFPSEAQLAMRIAEADSTEKFVATRLKEIGLKENPKIDKRLRERFDALTNTGSSIAICCLNFYMITYFILIKKCSTVKLTSVFGPVYCHLINCYVL